MGVLFGISADLIETTRPKIIQNGIKLHLNVNVGYVNTIDMNIQSLMINVKDSGELARILNEAWKLDNAPYIGEFKFEMHESKVRKRTISQNTNE